MISSLGGEGTIPMLPSGNSRSGRLLDNYRKCQRLISLIAPLILVLILSTLLVQLRVEEDELRGGSSAALAINAPAKSVESTQRSVRRLPKLVVSPPSNLKSDTSLVYGHDLHDLPRPPGSSIGRGAELSRLDQQTIAAAALKEAISLRDHGYSFRILVYAWKRRASLKRLLDSLLVPSYHGFPVHLDFHMDGGAHPAVVGFIEQFYWPHGRMRITRHGDRVGLEKTIMSSWLATDDKELAFLFEDDIEVSPHYFDFSLISLHRLVLPKGRRPLPGAASAWVDRLVGISLNTPRYNEIIYPPVRWTPPEVIGGDETLFLFGLPCSWGALYFPWKWREFLTYYYWRSSQPPCDILDDAIPDSATRLWRRSWKKFLIEHMYMRGEFVLYANLEGQVSLSTHWREPGEHTDMNPQEPLVDELGTLVLDYFTVPLLDRTVDEDQLLRLLSNRKGLREMPLVSFHHERVHNLHALTQLGLVTRGIMGRAGWSDKLSGDKREQAEMMDGGVSSPGEGLARRAVSAARPSGCLLDELSFPVRRPSSEAHGQVRYLIYEPQLRIRHQVDALHNALAYAKILNRTLLLPDVLVAASSDNGTGMARIPLESLVKLGETRSQGIQTALLSQLKQAWIDRIIYNLPWNLKSNSLLSDFNDDYLVSLQIVPLTEIVMHSFPLNETDIRAAYNECQDVVLAFRHLYASFGSLADASDDAQFRTWLRGAVRWSPPIAQLLETFVSTNASSSTTTGCVLFSRAACGPELENRMKGEEDRLVAFRTCRASTERTLEYLIEDATALQLDLKTVYFINEEAPSALDPVSASSKNLRIITRGTIVGALRTMENDQEEGSTAHGQNALGGLSEEALSGVAELVEFELCTSAAFFLGSQFSLYAQEIIHARADLPSNTFGKTVGKGKKGR